MSKPETVMSINGSYTFEEADEKRSKLRDPERYGLFCICTKENTQLWCVMPKEILNAIMNHKERT